MAVTTINVTGMILGPDGVGAAGGWIEVRAAAAGTPDDGGAAQLLPPLPMRVPIGLSGAVDFDIVPSSEISGGTYVAVIHWPNGQRSTRSWTAPDADCDIGDL